MKGNNELRLCPAEMNAAVEHYLNTVVMKQPVSVAHVSQSSTDVFQVFLREALDAEPEQK